MSLRRKVSKLLRALGHPLTRRALRRGVAASYEHAALLAGLGPLDTIVDVGANAGQFALLARLVQPGARVHSFEPQAAEATRFEAVLGHEAQVTLHRCALGAAAGTAEIHITARKDSSSLLEPEAQAEIFPGTHKVGTETVRVARLGEVLPAEAITGAALLKIDVQGFEGEVLEGSTDVLGRFAWIYCEMSFIPLYAGQPLAADLIPWLAGRGFRLASVETEALMVRQGRAVQADFLFRNAQAG